MIISASRRTDIPTFYSEWFLNRLREGYVIFNSHHQAASPSRIALTPDVVDCIAFRTKNPAPMIGKLDQLRDYNYFFQVTMNPYGWEMESHVPPLEARLDTFKQLARSIGPERMVWRYDPVMITPKYDHDFHARAFEYLTKELAGMAHRCMIGFIELHQFVAARTNSLGVKDRDREDIYRVAAAFGETARRHNLDVTTCAEGTALEQFGIGHGACVDRRHVESLVGYKFSKVREKYLRPHCECMESVDIGAYDTCLNGCTYCYATVGKPRLIRDPHAPSLDPAFPPEGFDPADIKVVGCRSLRNPQPELF